MSVCVCVHKMGILEEKNLTISIGNIQRGHGSTKTQHCKCDNWKFQAIFTAYTNHITGLHLILCGQRTSQLNDTLTYIQPCQRRTADTVNLFAFRKNMVEKK